MLRDKFCRVFKLRLPEFMKNNFRYHISDQSWNVRPRCRTEAMVVKNYSKQAYREGTQNEFSLFM